MASHVRCNLFDRYWKFGYPDIADRNGWNVSRYVATWSIGFAAKKPSGGATQGAVSLHGSELRLEFDCLAVWPNS